MSARVVDTSGDARALTDTAPAPYKGAITTLAALMLLSATVAQAQDARITGHWQGALDVGAARLRLAVHITKDEQGKLAATLDSLDQNARGIPVARTTLTGNQIRLEIPAIRAEFAGSLNADGSELAGTFTQGVARPLRLKHVAQIAEPRRPQAPLPPFPYELIEVGSSGLAGTFTIPKNGGPFPAVLLISGSGPQDRDEGIAGHKPFWVIADFLSRRGFAVLRVDDRGTGRSQGNSAQQTLDDKTEDVLAGLRFLRSRPEIDTRHMGVIGHSEGGVIGPVAALRSTDIAFIVMLAGVGTSMDETLALQADNVLRSSGAPEEVVRLNHEIQSVIFRTLRAEPNLEVARDKLRTEWAKRKAGFPERIQRSMGSAADASFEQQLATVTSPAMRSLILHDPRSVLKQIRVPVLALNGSKDLQVSAAQNLPAITAALAEAGNTDFSIVNLPGLNHLFQKCDKCSIAEYGELEETFSLSALALVGEWLSAHVR